MSLRIVVALAAGAGAVLVAGLWVTASGRASAVIECDDVALGTMRPGEERAFELHLRNRGRGADQIVVQPDCGCITHSVGDRSLVVEGGADATIQMLLVAPCQPGLVAKSVRLSQANPAPGAAEAVAKVSGAVEAGLWAEPCRATANLTGEKDLSVQLLVHHRESATLEAHNQKGVDGQIEILPLGAKTSRLTATYKHSSLAASGGLVIEIRPREGTPNAETVHVPVHWTKCSVLSFSPPRLLVAEGKHDYRVYIPRASSRTGSADANEMEVEPAVPWLKVKAEAATDAGVMVHLAIDDAAHKELGRQKTVLRARLKGESYWTTLDAIAAR